MSALVDCARSMEGQILAARPEMDRLRRLPDALAAALADAGLYRLCIPKDFAGHEADPRTMVETIEAIAEIDASVAWCVMISATTGVFGAYLDEDTAGEIFKDPGLIFSGVYAPLGRATIEGDAFRVTGQWKWNSGGQNATWLCGGCVIYENGAPRMLTDKIPDQRMMIFPARDATFIDTWHTSGLRGSGSGDMAVSNLLAPRARSVSLISDRPRLKSALYAFPVFGLLAIGIAAVACGNARAALKEFGALVSTKRTPTGRTLGERASVQAAYADASARMLAARALLIEQIEAGWAEAQTTATIAIDRRAMIRLAATHLTRTAADVVRVVQDLAGGSGVFLADPLHRRLADAQTMTAHVMTAPATYELTGRVLLGVPVSAVEL